jgi:hypothetical protein
MAGKFWDGSHVASMASRQQALKWVNSECVVGDF